MYAACSSDTSGTEFSCVGSDQQHMTGLVLPRNWETLYLNLIGICSQPIFLCSCSRIVIPSCDHASIGYQYKEAPGCF